MTPPGDEAGRLRVTVTAAARRVDVSLASDVPVAGLAVELSEILGLTPSDTPPGLPVSARAPRLVPSVGPPLAGDATLTEAGVRSGALLALLPPDDPGVDPPPLDPADRVARVIDEARGSPTAEEVTLLCGALAVLAGVAAVASTLACVRPGPSALATVAVALTGVGAGCLLPVVASARGEARHGPRAVLGGLVLGGAAGALALGVAATLSASPALAAVALAAAGVLASAAEPGLAARLRARLLPDDPAQPESGTLDVGGEIDRLESGLVSLLVAQAVTSVLAGALLGGFGSVGLLAVVASSCVHGSRVPRWHGRALLAAQSAPAVLGLVAAVVAAAVAGFGGRAGAPLPFVTLAVTLLLAGAASVCALTRFWRLRLARVAGVVGGVLLGPMLAACGLLVLARPEWGR